MKLVIEDGDQTKVSLAPGEYDLDDLRAVRSINIKGGAHPGSYHDIEIELGLHAGMEPEPGSTGEPHFKFGVTIKDNVAHNRQDVTIFGRPENVDGAQASGYKAEVDNYILHGQSPTVVEADARAIIEPGVRAVADEIVAALVKRAAEQVASPAVATQTGRTQTRSPNQAAQDAFFGLPSSKPKGKCDECGGSGVWKNPASGVESDCSKGCSKP